MERGCGQQSRSKCTEWTALECTYFVTLIQIWIYIICSFPNLTQSIDRSNELTNERCCLPILRFSIYIRCQSFLLHDYCSKLNKSCAFEKSRSPSTSKFAHHNNYPFPIWFPTLDLNFPSWLTIHSMCSSQLPVQATSFVYINVLFFSVINFYSVNTTTKKNIEHKFGKKCLKMTISQFKHRIGLH